MTAVIDPILVADDDDRVASLFTYALSEAGYQVVRAADGLEALDVIARQPISLVVLDSRMPRLDGAGVIDALRADRRTERLPIIVVTAETDVDHRVRGLDAGADDYLAKPVDIDELVARVRTQLRSQAVWADAALRDIGERSAVLGAIAGLALSGEPEEMAGVIVRHLLDLSDCGYAAILWFPPGGSVVPLAVAAPTGQPAAAPPAGLAARIRSQSNDGPVVHDIAEPGALGSFAGPGVAAVVAAPFRNGSAILGVVMLGLRPNGHVDRQGARSRLLSAAIDASSVVSVALGPGLGRAERHSADRRRLEEILRVRAFAPVYQPLVRLADKGIVGYEALTRFDDGTPPDIRFAEANRVGLGADFEVAAIERAIESASDLPEEAWLTLNVSPTLVIERTRVVDVLRSTRRKVVLEITEHAAIDDYALVRAALDRMRPLAGVAIDDAGAGFASLRHILELKPDLVKLDASLVRGIETDPIRQSLVAGLVHFGGTAGLELLGEAIETDAEAACLETLGVRLGQGYLFGRPAPIPRRLQPSRAALEPR
jgi:EAL domain-containing protein (putative c-di-GMP-specific phosphodiesterase class I)/FixJ family two-component response regulator